MFWRIILIFACISPPQAWSAEESEPATKKSEISEILDSMGYPELQVVPRASERLVLEAKSEDLFTHWPIQISGLATLFVGFTAKSTQRPDLSDKQKSDATTIAAATFAVGLGWIAGTAILAAQHPYRAGSNAVNKNTGKDERSTLLRERLSEEALERPARVMRVLETVSIVTNFSVNAMAAVHATDSGKITAGLGALMAFLPLMFEDHSISVFEKHTEYKRKIYTPVKSASLSFDGQSKTFTPMTQLTWAF